jgi:hypothetical protein
MPIPTAALSGRPLGPFQRWLRSERPRLPCSGPQRSLRYSGSSLGNRNSDSGLWRGNPRVVGVGPVEVAVQFVDGGAEPRRRLHLRQLPRRQRPPRRPLPAPRAAPCGGPFPKPVMARYGLQGHALNMASIANALKSSCILPGRASM